MSTARTIAKNTTFNFIATACDTLVTFVVGVALARGLGVEQYGFYSLLTWFMGLAALLANQGLGEMARRFIAEFIGRGDKNGPASIVRLTLLLRLMIGVAISLVIILFSGYWARLFAGPDERIYYVLIAFILVPNVLNLALLSIFAGFQKYEYKAYFVLATYPIRAVLVIVLMVMGFGVLEVLLLNLAIWSVGVLIGIYFVSRLISARSLFSIGPLQIAARKEALKYAITITGITAVNYFLWRQAEILFLGMYRPVEEVGYYNLATKIPSMAMALVPMVLGAVLLPTVSEQFGRGDMDKLRRIYVTSGRYLTLLALPLAGAGIALARPLIGVLYGEEYAPAILIMQILFVPFVMRGISDAAIAVMYGINRPSFVLKIGVVLACLNMGLNLWLIPTYGILGAAIGSSVPRLLTLPIYIRFASKQIEARWPVRDSIKIALATLLVGLALFGLQSYVNMLLGLILSILIGPVLYAVLIVLFRIINKEDIAIFYRVGSSLPPALRRHYTTVIQFMEKVTGGNLTT